MKNLWLSPTEKAVVVIGVITIRLAVFAGLVWLAVTIYKAVMA